MQIFEIYSMAIDDLISFLCDPQTGITPSSPPLSFPVCVHTLVELWNDNRTIIESWSHLPFRGGPRGGHPAAELVLFVAAFCCCGKLFWLRLQEEPRNVRSHGDGVKAHSAIHTEGPHTHRVLETPPKAQNLHLHFKSLMKWNLLWLYHWSVLIKAPWTTELHWRMFPHSAGRLYKTLKSLQISTHHHRNTGQYCCSLHVLIHIMHPVLNDHIKHSQKQPPEKQQIQHWPFL